MTSTESTRKPQKIAVLAYGSLLAHPGEWLGKNMLRLIRCKTPFPVEYAGRAMTGRGGAPTLMKVLNGNKVLGGLIVLKLANTQQNIDLVRDELAKRERERTGRSKYIKDGLNVRGFYVVYSDFEEKILGDDLTAPTLAKLAIDSIRECAHAGHPHMNGLRYLLENIEWGVETKLTRSYKDAILKATSTKTLEDAEAVLISRAYEEKPNQESDSSPK